MSKLLSTEAQRSNFAQLSMRQRASYTNAKITIRDRKISKVILFQPVRNLKNAAQSLRTRGLRSISNADDRIYHCSIPPVVGIFHPKVFHKRGPPAKRCGRTQRKFGTRFPKAFHTCTRRHSRNVAEKVRNFERIPELSLAIGKANYERSLPRDRSGRKRDSSLDIVGTAVR